MTTDQRQRRIVRDLARAVADTAARPEQAERIRLWTSCNTLRPVRPVVRLDPQNGWPELENAWLHLECEDQDLGEIERALRLKLLRAEHLPDDCPTAAAYDVPVVVRGDGYGDYGIPIELTRSEQPMGAYHLVQLVRGEEDLARLPPRPITVDHVATDRALGFATDLLGDVLAVTRCGKSHWRFGLSRVLVHWRGLEQMMLDLYDNPDLLHRLMGFPPSP